MIPFRHNFIRWRHHFIKENIINIPNGLTTLRILSSPAIGYCIIKQQPEIALAGIIFAGLSDGLDGWIARKYNRKTALGSVLDPLADKILMTTLVYSLYSVGHLSLPLASLILGRDILLIGGTFYYRYKTLPYPKTLSRYFDLALPTAEVKPPLISKINTALQLGLMVGLVAGSIYDFNENIWMEYLKFAVGTTTIWSGITYLFYSHKLIKIL